MQIKLWEIQNMAARLSEPKVTMKANIKTVNGSIELKKDGLQISINFVNETNNPNYKLYNYEVDTLIRYLKKMSE